MDELLNTHTTKTERHESKSKKIQKVDVVFFCPDTGKGPDMNKADTKSWGEHS